ncbi:hypothetical protein CYMTET_53697 [Cymbomonas tetramitiformis]|uniref:sn-1-specific diacylglycerol lipase n=1 Tax=Cymbomonas tetramitiformis TaxID=36881 RepID=A0AAE0BI83_9CHLO|nr:hypothetical protein CYMTET_53697 [Cymbomonas tetramitiformis]
MYYLWRTKFQHRSSEFKRNASIRAGQEPLKDRQLLDVLIWMAGVSDITYLNTSSESELYKTLNKYDAIPSSLHGAARAARTAKLATEAGQSDPSKPLPKQSLDESVPNPSWEILFLQSSAQKAVPVHFVAVDHTRRCLIMAIRGTFGLTDAVTMAGANLQPVTLGRKSPNCAAHAGIVKSANTLVELHVGTLCRYAWEGYQVRLVGHSYGGAVAAMIATYLHELEPSITAFCFACPPCVTAQLAEKTRHCTTTVVLDDDVIPRLTRHSIFELHNELVETERNLGNLISKDKDRFTTEPWDTTLYEWMRAKSDELEKGGLERKSCTVDIPPEEELLYVPGTVIHLHRSTSTQNLGVEAVQQIPEEEHFGAAVADPQFFRKIELSKTMVTDHLISNVRDAIRKYRDSLPLSAKPLK